MAEYGEYMGILEKSIVTVACPICDKVFCVDVYYSKQDEQNIAEDAMLAFSVIGFKEQFTVKHKKIIDGKIIVDKLMLKHIGEHREFS